VDLEERVAAGCVGDELIVDGGGDFLVNFTDLVFSGSRRDIQFAK
jgi:hypothetical protein